MVDFTTFTVEKNANKRPTTGFTLATAIADHDTSYTRIEIIDNETGEVVTNALSKKPDIIIKKLNKQYRPEHYENK